MNGLDIKVGIFETHDDIYDCLIIIHGVSWLSLAPASQLDLDTSKVFFLTNQKQDFGGYIGPAGAATSFTPPPPASQ